MRNYALRPENYFEVRAVPPARFPEGTLCLMDYLRRNACTV